VWFRAQCRDSIRLHQFNLICTYIRTFIRLTLFIVVFPFCTNGGGEFRVRGLFIVEDPFVTVRCRTAIEALFLYFMSKCNIISCSSTCFLTNTYNSLNDDSMLTMADSKCEYVPHVQILCRPWPPIQWYRDVCCVHMILNKWLTRSNIIFN
jgi:hypothetical protein